MNIFSIQKLKMIILIIFLSIFYHCKNAEKETNFEGSITYGIKVESDISDLHKFEVEAVMGDTMVYFVKNGMFLEKYNGTKLDKIINYSTNGICYTLFKNKDTLFSNNQNITPVLLDSMIYEHTNIYILGFKCDKITLYTREFKIHYWFNSDYLSINPSLFIKDKRMHKNSYYNEAKAIPLQWTVDYGVLRYNFKAIKVSYLTLDKKIFELPSVPKALLN